MDRKISEIPSLSEKMYSETEYNRIYDIAILNLSNKLLSILDVETSNNEGSD